jgi:hypothetical protein
MIYVKENSLIKTTYKITIRHANKHNRPRGQTIYQIIQRLFVALQRDVGEQLIAYECTG